MQILCSCIEYQNKGIGTKLMENVLKYIKDEKKYYTFFVLTEDTI